MIAYELDSLFPRLSESTLILTSVFADDEEEEELSGAAAASLRGTGVGGINAFFLVFLSATVEISREGRSARTIPPRGDV